MLELPVKWLKMLERRSLAMVDVRARGMGRRRKMRDLCGETLRFKIIK